MPSQKASSPSGTALCRARRTHAHGEARSSGMHTAVRAFMRSPHNEPPILYAHKTNQPVRPLSALLLLALVERAHAGEPPGYAAATFRALPSPGRSLAVGITVKL
jgi:hypothetical protein